VLTYVGEWKQNARCCITINRLDDNAISIKPGLPSHIVFLASSHDCGDVRGRRQLHGPVDCMFQHGA